MFSQKHPWCLANLVLATALVSAVLLAETPSSLAAGKIVGVVKYDGNAEEKEFLFSKFPNAQFCAQIGQGYPDLVRGERRIVKMIEVSPAAELKDAVVSIRDIEDEAFMKDYKGTTVKSELCQWSPRIGVVVLSGNFWIENGDADPNDPKSMKGVLYAPVGSVGVIGGPFTTIFRVGLGKKGDAYSSAVLSQGSFHQLVLLTDSRQKPDWFVRLTCDQHEHMVAYFLSVSNPYFAPTSEEGRFEISNVPPGKHKIKAWHPIA